MSFTDSIPSDYNGVMGAPISFLDKYNPEQFEILGSRLYLSVDFYDKSSKLVLKIIRNKVKLNENNIFEIADWGRNRLKIINQYQEPIEIICHKTGEVELNGVFYCNGNRFMTSSNGLQIN